jgi:glycosyltransferase involved in cell wall biosynthesis
MKETLVFQGPCFTRSGYGDHSRDLLKSLRKMDRFDIKIIPMRWGNTPQNQADSTTEFGRWMLERVVTQLNVQPDVFIQVSVANEFTPVGKFNIGITAAVETNIIPKDFIEGSNKMDLILVPSEFTKGIMKNTGYQEQNSQTKQIIREHKITKPIEVLFEGVDLEVFLNNRNTKTDILESVETDFNFLYVGHWLRGDLGQDRKDVGMLIKTFTTVFKSLPKKSQPGLILKTSQSGFSITDRENIKNKINEVIGQIGDECPPIYLIHGDLNEEEMASLYHHPKVKAMVSFTKGEGYGRPLAEFTVTGKPILASNWSGHLDFLPSEHSVLLSGSLTNVHQSAADKFLLAEAKWFTVNYSDAANKMYDVFNNYSKYLDKSKNLKQNTINNFSLESMHIKFVELLDTYIKTKPKLIPINLPKLQKI